MTKKIARRVVVSTLVFLTASGLELRTPCKLMRNGLGCEKVVLKMSISFMANQITIRTI